MITIEKSLELRQIDSGETFLPVHIYRQQIEMKRQELIKLRQHLRRHDRVRAFDMHSAKVHSVSWSADGKRLASGSVDKKVSVSIFDGNKLRPEFVGTGHADQVDEVSWHKTDPDLLASASTDKSIRVWDLRQKKGLASVNTKGANINIGWSVCGHYIAYGDKDDKITIMDTRNFKVVHTEPFYKETNQFAWDKSGRFFLAATSQGRVLIYSFPDMKQVQALQANPAQCNCLSISMDPTGQLFAVGATDALITIWDLETLVCLRTVDRLDYPVRAVSFSHDGKLLAAGSEDSFIDVAHSTTAERVTDLKVEAETFSVAWHPSTYVLAYTTASDNFRDGGAVKLFGLSD